MEKIVNTLIDEAVQKVDTYTNNGSTWLIFTDDKRWVIELTKDGTLWYNYNFFNSLFAYTSMDVIENQHYITKWVENNVINKKKPVKNEVKDTNADEFPFLALVDDTIQNGVKETHSGCNLLIDDSIEYAIQNGVKDTKENWSESKYQVEDTIQNGVKETLSTAGKPLRVEDAIENGVKDTQTRLTDEELEVEDTIQNGVKRTGNIINGWTKSAEDTIQNGVKETSFVAYGLGTTVEDIIQNGVKRTDWYDGSSLCEVEETIQNGVKETKSDRGYTNHFRKKHNVDGVIQNGVKETRLWLNTRDTVVEGAIQNGVKDTRHEYKPLEPLVEDAIRNGVKSTFNRIIGSYKPVEDAIQNGVKNTYSDKIPHEYDWTDQFDVKEVIETGVKHTEKSLQIDGSCVIEDVIKEGVKHTEYGDWEDGDERLDNIIKNGVKQTCAQIPSIDAVVERVVEEGIKETNMEEHHRLREVVQTVKNGVKETKSVTDDLTELLRCDKITSHEYVDTLTQDYWTAFVIEKGIKETHDDVYPHTARIDGVIKNGIKEVQPLPAQDGNRDWGVYYNRKEDRTKPHTQYVNDVIENGEKI